jgi:redox-sensitive bicupin YhaK (pirin superfamily)
MITIRNHKERGVSRLGWLDSRHTFSFADYQDPRHMGFRSLRVINDDRVSPGAGFPSHGHRDMDIISYVLDGELAHKDSLGNGTVIRPGEVQRMSAGTGIVHSEFNPSKSDPVHFLQIWIIPEQQGLAPSYEQKDFHVQEPRAALQLVAAAGGRDGALTLHEDAQMYAGRLAAGARVVHPVAPGRGVWVHVARGNAALNGSEMKEGDGAAVEDESEVTLEARTDSELLLFDLR